MKFYRFLAIVVFGFQVDFNIHAQSEDHDFHSVHLDRGFIIPHHEDMYHLYRLTTSLQYDYLRPIEATKTTIGFTLFGAYLGSSVIGNGFSGSFHMRRQMGRSSTFTGHFGLALGLGLITNPYDVEKNPTNRAIGSYGNAFGQAYIEANLRLSQYTSLTTSLRFSHFSNGAWSAPNLGINIPSVSVGITRLVPTKRTVISGELAERLWVPFTALRIGRKGLDIDDRRYFWVPVLEFGFARRISTRSILRISAAMHGDPYYRFEKFEPLEPFSMANGVDAGVSIGYQQWFGKWGMLFDAGWYLYKPDSGYKTPYFEALGLSYRFNKDWEFMARLKANKTTADLIELGFTYHW